MELFVLLWIHLSIHLTAISTGPQFNNPVSLSNGSFGYVIIEDDAGTRGLVCDDEFTDSNAGCEVVCRQLGLQ